MLIGCKVGGLAVAMGKAILAEFQFLQTVVVYVVFFHVGFVHVVHILMVVSVCIMFDHVCMLAHV